MRRLILVAVACAQLALQGGATRADERDDFFEAKIRPVLAATCFRCHGDTKTSAGLRIDSREALLKGGDAGAVLVPGDPDESLLIQAIRRLPDVAAMPPDKEKALRPDQVADFVTWVKAGAVWPAKSAKFEATRHWAFEPIRDPAVPQVQDRAWVKTSIDGFIRSKQETAAIQPAPEADKLTLLRRVTFDLTGLPPTPAEVDAFLADSSPAAYATVIDRLLASPAYGERWGRHWLDVVRYADTAGETADYPVPLAWKYRNYVIDAFNQDKPYDEFLREQIAGDVLANQGPPEKYAERVTATGYLAISRRFGFDSENYHHLTIQDTIDTLGQSVLGLSLGCARCHDHKFDPLTTTDYYGLYGIFDSSRYAFPGSEQKQKVRSMVPLLPPAEAQRQWQGFEQRVAQLTGELSSQKRPVPAAVLRSLTDMDGDFELQAPAAGGSNGVLVPPWLYRGKIAVTNAAQSPFKNLHPQGRVGASVPADAGDYRIEQAIHPLRSRENCDTLSVNLDFRLAAGKGGAHRLCLVSTRGVPAFEVHISAESIGLKAGGETFETLTLQPNQWHNLQLVLDLQGRMVSGRVGKPGAIQEFSRTPLALNWPGAIAGLWLDAANTAGLPAIEFDNVGVQDAPLAPVTTDSPNVAPANGDIDPVVLAKQVQVLGGIDGDFELQTKDAPPTTPWGPGPNSVVRLSTSSQSPFSNLFAPGELGIHMPNRGEYDGFGQTLSNVQPDSESRLFVSFDFRCAAAGGDGSWRYYIGHGPGVSAAVELFFNGKEFFRRSADAREPVCPLTLGEWYQVQLTLNLKARTYTGVLASPRGKTEFAGQFASGWDGGIDYTFIDSYGHIGGVRPALDADNFVIGDKALPSLDAILEPKSLAERATRRSRVLELHRQLAALQTRATQSAEELNTLLTDGPFAMTYGMAEGTPHAVRTQLRGEPDQLGPEVPRGFISVLGGGPLASDVAGSGRLELALWLTKPGNPLTARVMANRIWQYHFGQGLVKTSNDFGVRGLPPTHPELLDHLATQFMRGGWSIKAMHRLILLSATYQQSAEGEAKAAGMDLLASFSRRRLSAEEIRDAILAVSGELDATPAQAHPFPSPIGFGYSQHGPFSAVYDHNKRSVYLMTQRLRRHPFLALFDGADPNATTPERLGTTVPTQALYFLNDPFVHRSAEKWAERLLASLGEQSSNSDARLVETAWKRGCGRALTPPELTEATEFLAAYREELKAAKIDNPGVKSLAAYLRTIFGSNEFLHVE